MATKKKAAAAAKKPAAASTKLSTTDAIKAGNKSLLVALAAGDAAGVAAKYSKKAILMASGMPAQKGRKKIQAFWAAGISAMGVKSASLRTTEVDELGTTAIECGAYTLKGDKRVVLDVGKYVVVWKKEDGAWKLHRDIFNSDKAAG